MATLSKLRLPDVDQLSPIRALYSLRPGHLGVLSHLVSRIPGAWSLDRHEGCDGDLTVIVSAQDPNSAIFVISRTKEGFHLGLNEQDEYEKLGSFSSLDELVSEIEARIARPIEPISNFPNTASY
jgi:hypothetical protein